MHKTKREEVQQMITVPLKDILTTANLPACYGQPSDSLLHKWQLQRTTPNIYYRCKLCGGGKYGE
jgi:hypothetical protein